MALKVNPFEGRRITRRPLSADKLKEVPPEEIERLRKNHERLFGAIPGTEEDFERERALLLGRAEVARTVGSSTPAPGPPSPAASASASEAAHVRAPVLVLQSNTIEHAGVDAAVSMSTKSALQVSEAVPDDTVLQPHHGSSGVETASSAELELLRATRVPVALAQTYTPSQSNTIEHSASVREGPAPAESASSTRLGELVAADRSGVVTGPQGLEAVASAARDGSRFDLGQSNTTEHNPENAGSGNAHKDGVNRTRAVPQSHTIEHGRVPESAATEHRALINSTQLHVQSNTIEHKLDSILGSTEHNLPNNRTQQGDSPNTIEHTQSPEPPAAAPVFDSQSPRGRNPDPLCAIDPNLIEHNAPPVFDSPPSRVRKSASLSSIGDDNKRTQDDALSNTSFEHNREHNRTHATLPTAVQQLAILRYLLHEQQKSGLGHSPRLRRDKIAQALGISSIGVRTQLVRLVSGGYLERLDARAGRGEPGSVYRIPASVATRLLRTQESNTIEHRTTLNRTQEPNTPIEYKPSSSTSSLSTTTTTNTSVSDLRQFAERLQLACDRYGLTDHAIGPNDLQPLLRNATFTSEADLLESAEHLAFYLSSEAAKTITHPKAWAISTLRKGYYAPPAGFVPWEARVAEAKLKSTRARAQILKELRKQQLEADFDVWLQELPNSERRSLLGNVPFAEPNSRAARAVLLQHYAAKTGQVELLEQPGA